MKSKPTAKKIGMIGSNEVMQYGDAPMIVFGKTWLSAGKVKAVLANLEACRQFLLKYDAEAPKPAAVTEDLSTKEAIAARIAQLQAKLNGGNGNAGNNRLDPIQKSA